MTATLPSAMPPRATGTIESHDHRDGRTVSFYLRVRADGQRHRLTLGTNHKGWNEERARVELERVLSRIERGTWTPPARSLPAPQPTSETFHRAVSRWWQRREVELSARTRTDYRWRIDHLLRLIARDDVASLDPGRVDEVRAQLVGRGLGPRSVNMVLGLLAQVLDDAVEARMLDANPARGRRRRMPLPKQRRTFLEPDMVVDLLAEAGAWEQSLPPHQRYGRRPLLACLCLGGFRIAELLAARRAALDLHGGRLRVGDAKTEAGLRDVELTEFLLSEIRGHVAHVQPRTGESSTPPYIFPSRNGRALNASNVRNRLLAESVKRANAKREAEGKMLLPAKVTPHTLRRTFASLCFFAGRDPRWVMAQLGHADARLTLAVYAQTMQRQRIDEALVHKLMRFPHEEEKDGQPPDTAGSRGHSGRVHGAP